MNKLTSLPVTPVSAAGSKRVKDQARRGKAQGSPRKKGRHTRTVKPPVQAKRHVLPRVLFVVGPTSSGKTDLGLKLAKELNGEVINADARQMYQEVDIGTGKPVGLRSRKGGRAAYVVDGIPHYLMDMLSPERSCTVAEWRDMALDVIKQLTRKGKLPIVVGGTGLYVSSLIDNYQFPRVEPQPMLRAAFDSKSLEELVQVLLAADPEAAGVVDLKNKRRVIRALEVVTFSGMKFSEARSKAAPLVEAFQIGIRRTPEELYTRINASIDRMIGEGLVEEVRTLLEKGVPPDAPAMTSIGYTDIARYLRGHITLYEAINLIKRHTRNYAKRQWTWFKRDTRIHWSATGDEAMKKAKTWARRKR